MALLNYTTDVPAEKSIGQIQAILTKKGARQILTQIDENGNTVGLAFQIVGPQGLMGFRLPADVDAVYKVMLKSKNYTKQFWEKGKYITMEEKYRPQNMEQARKVAWRILKDWIEAQMAILETQMVTLDQVFLPYAVTKSGNTLYKEMQESGYLLLN